MTSASRDPLALIDAAYRVGEPAERWLHGILEAMAGTLGCEPCGLATLYDATKSDWIDVTNTTSMGLPQPFVHEIFHQPPTSPEHTRALVQLYRRGLFGSTSELVTPLVPSYAELFARFGLEDFTALITTDPTFRGCVLGVATPRRKNSPRTRYLWRKLSAHLSAGLRLRRLLAPLLGERPELSDHAEAVLSPERKVLHAVGPAKSEAAREALRNAVVGIDAARGTPLDDRFTALDLWNGLVAGRWSLVENFERDGRRYFLAYRNDPRVARHRALTPRELQVWTYAVTGHSNKLISYALGLSLPAVAKCLKRARHKLGGSATLEALETLGAAAASPPARGRRPTDS